MLVWQRCGVACVASLNWGAKVRKVGHTARMDAMKGARVRTWAVSRCTGGYPVGEGSGQKESGTSAEVPLSGAGRNRTAVQTTNKRAFYMLSLWLVFEPCPDTDTQARPYLLCCRSEVEVPLELSHLY